MLILGRFREKGVLLVSWGEILDFGVLENMKLKFCDFEDTVKTRWS